MNLKMDNYIRDLLRKNYNGNNCDYACPFGSIFLWFVSRVDKKRPRPC